MFADPNFVRHSTDSQHICIPTSDDHRLPAPDITDAILFALQNITKHELESSNILNLLISGVQIHLESSLPNVRHLGMVDLIHCCHSLH